jgi:hypothetical protein
MSLGNSKEQTANSKGRRRARLALAFGACCLLLSACAERESANTVDVVSGIPWDGPEALRYVIIDSDEEIQGDGVLAVMEGEDDGTVVLVQQFSDQDGNSDTSVLVADAETLRPIAGERTIIDADDDRRSVALSRYERDDDGNPIVRIAGLSYDPADEDDPSLRCSPDEIDSEHYYDNDSSLFLWRTITFEEGWTALYTNVLANQREQWTQELRVRKEEPVVTPAGDFDAWLVGIAGQGRETQSAWYAQTPDHKLLVYNNRQDQIFLYAGEGEMPDVELPAELPEECVGE